jgi:ABC-2 type transport system ATP-binding protein
MIRVEGLTRRYADLTAVRNLSFTVETGEIVGFLGPNGAGKTTTLRILAGYLPATGGSVSVAGHDVVEASREVRRSVGYLPEDVPLYRDLRVRDYLTYLAGLKEVPAKEVGREVERVIDRAGLDPVRNRLIGKCSKGYRQRTGLAGALLGDPPVLLLDEPTSGLDPNQVVSVRELVSELSGSKTVLLSSHILPEVVHTCGRVLIIHEGELVGEGTPEELARRVAGSGILDLRLDGPAPSDLLEGVPGVVAVSVRGADRFEVNVSDPEAAAAAVSRRAVERGFGIVELGHRGADLEEVFRRLTADRTGDGDA